MSRSATPDIDALRRDRSALIRELQRGGVVVKNAKSIRCPFHGGPDGDKNPSAGICEQGGGVLRFHCLACGVSEDIFGLRARFQGKAVEGVIREWRASNGGVKTPRGRVVTNDVPPKPEHRDQPQKKGKAHSSVDRAIAAAKWGLEQGNGSLTLSDVGPWTDTHADGTLNFVVARFDRADGGKVFTQVRCEGDQWFVGGITKRTLYRLADIASQTAPVLIVDGEKCADLAAPIMSSTTWSHGAQSVTKSDWSPLAGREVWIWSDVGAEGVVDQIAGILRGLDPTTIVKRVEHGLIEAGDDIEQWLQARECQEPEELAKAIRSMVVDVPTTSSFFDTVDALNAVVRESNQAISVADSTETTSTPMRIGNFNPRAKALSDILRPNPFPLHLLPEPIQAYVMERAGSINVDPKSVTLPLLTAINGAVASARRLEIDTEYHQPPILWSLGLDGSGTRKTSCLDAASCFIKSEQNARHESHKEALARFEAEELRRKAEKQRVDGEESPNVHPGEMKQLYTSEFTIESIPGIIQNNKRGLMIFADEFSGTLASFGRYAMKGGGSSSEEAFLNDAWNGNSYVRNRSSNANPKNKFIHLRYAHTTISGFIQPAVMMGAISQSMTHSGFLARFIMQVPQQMPPKRRERSRVDGRVKQRMHAMFQNLLSMDTENEQSVTISLTSDAMRLIVDYDYEMQCVQKSWKLDPALGLFINKAQSHAARFALAHHLASAALRDQHVYSDRQLDATSIRAGIEMTQWAIEEQKRAYGLLTIGNDDAEVTDVAKYMMLQPGSETDAVRYSKNRNVNAATAHAHLESLINAGIAERVVHPIGRAGGRPKADTIRLLPELVQILKSADELAA